MPRLYPQIETGGFTPPSADRQLMAEISDAKAVEVSRSQRIGHLLLNRQLLGEAPPIVAPGSFISDLTTPSRAYEAICLASLGRPVMMVDMPGHGLSSPHSSRQTRDLCFNRSLSQQAAPMTEAVLSVLPPEDPIDHFGVSYGGLLCLEMARTDPNDRVGNVFGLDIPGVKRRWSLGLQLGYLLVDGQIGRRQYKKHLDGSSLLDSFDNFLDDFDQLGVDPAPGFVKNNPGLAGLNLFMSVAARPVALEVWAEIMKRKSANIDVVTAESSNVSDHTAIELFINSMAADYRKRSRQTVIPGEDHNIGLAPLMPRAVSWAARAYNSPPGS